MKKEITILLISAMTFFASWSTFILVPGSPIWEFLLIGLEISLIILGVFRIGSLVRETWVDLTILFLIVSLVAVGIYGYKEYREQRLKIDNMGFSSTEPHGVGDMTNKSEFYPHQDMWVYFEVSDFNIGQERRTSIWVSVSVNGPGSNYEEFVGVVINENGRNKRIPVWFNLKKYMPEDLVTGRYRIKIVAEDYLSDYLFKESTASRYLRVTSSPT